MQEEESEVHDLGWLERSKLHLTGLRNVVSNLKHADIIEQPSGHFSLLSTRDKGLRMPFLQETAAQISQAAKVGRAL